VSPAATYPHQSPIGFKAICILALKLKVLPLRIAADQKIVGAMSCPIGSVTDPWLLANPLMVHDIGGLGQKTTRFCWDAADPNQASWL
jgi:hypothetical protein